MKKLIFETQRHIRIKPKIDLYIVFFALSCLFILIAVAEFLTKNEAEYFRAQGRIVIATIILFIYRLTTSYDWVEHYKESINWIFGSINRDNYINASLLNIFLDFFIIFSLFFWVDIERVSFMRVSIVGIVYILFFMFSALKQFISRKLSKRLK